MLMKKQYLMFFLIFFYSFPTLSLGENNGDWQSVGEISDKCDFIGEAKLNVNFKTVKIKVQNWKWNDSSKPEEKFFKGKFRKNKTDIYISSRGIGYKHILEGSIDGNSILLAFSSTHTEINNRYGGCSFEFSKE